MRDLIQNTSTKGKVALAASAVGVLLVAVLLMRMASAPSFQTMVTGVDPAQTGKITAALDQKGVKWQLQNNGTAVAVDKGHLAEARIALAEQGLPQQGSAGWELFDKQKLGASNLQQQVTYQRALEGELARMIGQVQGVSNAQVNLVLPPEDQLFQNANSTAKASVLVTAGNGLDPGAVRGIAQLVSSGVKGLKPENVSITDGTGQLLWPTSNGDAGGTSATYKQAAENRYDAQMTANLNAMLTQTLGPGKGQVQVHSDLNVDQTTRDSLTYAKKGVALKTHDEKETLAGGSGGGGTAGAGSNIPQYSAGAGGGAGSNYKHNTKDTDWGVNKTVEHTKVAPGQVNKLDVAVLVDKTVPPASLQQLQSALASAAGINPKRGDTISVSQVAFAKQPVAKAPGMTGNMIGYAKYVALGIALLAFFFFMSRHLRKRESEALMGEPVWLRELDHPRTLAELEGAPATPSVPVGPGVPAPSPARVHIEELATKEPDRMAQQVRAWMNEE
jgi:flagellar M-ring protein FliF